MDLYSLHRRLYFIFLSRADAAFRATESNQNSTGRKCTLRVAAQIWPRAGFYRGLFRLKGTIQNDINAGFSTEEFVLWLVQCS